MQMDLFKQARKPAHIVAFPMERRSILIRDTASRLCALDYIAGRKFWGEHIRALKAQMRAIGIPCRQVDMEIRKYSEAVATAVDRSLPHHGAPPPTAA